MRIIAWALALLVISACNLSSQPATPTVQSIPTTLVTITAPGAVTPTALPGVTASPDITAPLGATRTPFANSAPPTTIPAGGSGFPTLVSGESAEISSPASGASVSGSPLYVSGVVHNLPHDQFTLEVFDAGGQPISSAQIISLSNPNHVADVPWSASVMLRSSYSGAAQIRISAQIEGGSSAVIGAVDVTITPSSAANPPPSGSSGDAILSPVNGSSVSGDPISVTGTIGGIPDNQFTLLLLDSRGTVLNS